MALALTIENCLPEDWETATLVGRIWLPEVGGPAVAAIKQERVVDITGIVPTVSELMNDANPLDRILGASGKDVGGLSEILVNSAFDAQDPSLPHFLAPVDLQAVKACGVTFAESMLERVIEERAQGDPSAAESIRGEIRETVGLDLGQIVPGSDEAIQLKAMLIDKGMWSQYLEVGIGPDAEVFTKSQPMSAVGIGAEVGLNSKSVWNNPEPEITLIVNARGEIVGATLGNDVNLRDIEGRSALLLGKAKDNNGSAAIGPFIRMFDDSYRLNNARSAELTLTVEGLDQFTLKGRSSMSKISRDVADLVAETIGPHHQYPDGFCLMTGTLFAPTDDRDAPGEGFTHKIGDVVRIATPQLGALVNQVNLSENIPAWTFGTGALMRNLSQRGLI
ncbi:MAG: fumarylacetoacetate hydrolase [Rhodospirillaceae bacterium]|nr:fumarylacetoacetate hydrolase [Rhodospirillaceae bacterium]